MKTSTVVVVGAVGLVAVAGVVYLSRRNAAAPRSGGIASGIGAALATTIPMATGKLFDYFSTPSAPSNTAVSTGVSNYLADATAKSDSETGDVGFGGWD